MGLSDDQNRKAKKSQPPGARLSPGGQPSKMKPMAKHKSSGRPMMSEEQKQKARELAKKKFEEKQKAEQEKIEAEKAKKAAEQQEEWESYSLEDDSSTKPKQKTDVGKRGLTQKQKNMAIQVERDITKAEALYEKAVGKYMRPDLDEALTLMRSALSLHPSNPKYHYNIAYIYSVRGDDDICLNHYKAFLRYAPDNDPDIDNVKARVIYYEKKIREALEINRHNKGKLI